LQLTPRRSGIRHARRATSRQRIGRAAPERSDRAVEVAGERAMRFARDRDFERAVLYRRQAADISGGQPRSIG